jgi:hypothetical protein
MLADAPGRRSPHTRRSIRHRGRGDNNHNRDLLRHRRSDEFSSGGNLMSAAARQRLSDMQPAQQAGILCNDPKFQRFAAVRSGLPDHQFSASAAGEYLRGVCQITSRTVLNTSKPAQAQFAALRTEFDAWSGRIAQQR